ncbi:MAG: threonine/serine exporter family protein [Sporolactobacillus sp.]
MTWYLMLLVQSITSFLATCAFGIIYNIPKKPLIHGGLIGMIAWLIYFFIFRANRNDFAATFAAAFVIAVLSHIFARLRKNPVIIYSVCGIIPLVPGGLTYTVMNQAVGDKYNLALHLGEKAFVLSGAIAMGLIFAEVLYPLTKKVFPMKRKKIHRRTTILQK